MDSCEISDVCDVLAPYDSHGKDTLLLILSKKDSELQKAADNKHQLQIEVDSLKESNRMLLAEVANLKTQLSYFTDINSACKKDKEDFDGEEEYAQKPMPDWSGGGPRSDEHESSLSISDMVRATAEAELKSLEPDQECGEETNEYVYDASSGYYYHPSTGYYWDPDSQLFYDYTSGTYYHYNESNGQYEVHSQIDDKQHSMSSEIDKNKGRKIASLGKSDIKTTTLNKEKHRRKSKKRTKVKAKASEKRACVASHDDDKEKPMDEEDNILASENGNDKNVSGDESSGSLATDESELESDPEDGEIISSDSSDVEIIEDQVQTLVSSDNLQSIDGEESASIYTSEQQIYPEAMADNYPPCIRAIIQESEKLCFGTLFIITCAGGSIGRDMTSKHCVQIPDIGVSKTHASIEYDHDDSCYKIMDLGSQNGTRINGRRLIQHNQTDDGKNVLKHGDLLQLGVATSLLLHIHKGHETCEECEPGQLQAKHKTSAIVPNVQHVVMSKEDRKQQQRKELKNIKKKYGLQNCHFENPGAIPTDPDYADKAHLRRKFIGSEHPSIQAVERPASVHSPIAASNKGHALLARMGWKEGQGLGKANSGIVEPINVQLRVNQSSGLGSAEGVSLSLDQVQDTNKAKRWSKARQRFNDITPSNTDNLSNVDDSIGKEKRLDSSTDQPAMKNSNSGLGSESCGSKLPYNVNNPPEATIPAPLSVPRPKPVIKWNKGSTEDISRLKADSNKDLS